MKTLNSIIDDVVLVVKATAFELKALRTNLFDEEWLVPNCSIVIETGRLAERRVAMDCRVTYINSHLVLFYFGCTPLVDNVMLEDWFCDRLVARLGKPSGWLTDAEHFENFLHLTR
jgi:hypothetical protein